jgi:hypothetical protein
VSARRRPSRQIAERPQPTHSSDVVSQVDLRNSNETNIAQRSDPIVVGATD